jgi:hypothetical protein
LIADEQRKSRLGAFTGIEAIKDPVILLATAIPALIRDHGPGPASPSAIP